MARIRFGWYRGRWDMRLSSAYALLAALLLETALVVTLLHIPLHVELVDRHSPTAENIAPRQVVAYVTLRPANKASTAADRITKSAQTLSGTSNVSRAAGYAVVDAATAAIDTLAGSLASPRQTSPQGFQAVRPRAIERSQGEVIYSIMRAIIQPGNDSAARMRVARQHAVDWTVGVRGQRYGMSPGALNLGKISLRFPLVFAEPLSLDSDRRREFRRVNEDTRSQAARAARDAAFDSAVASIRLRRSAEDRPQPNSRIKVQPN